MNDRSITCHISFVRYQRRPIRDGIDHLWEERGLEQMTGIFYPKRMQAANTKSAYRSLVSESCIRVLYRSLVSESCIGVLYRSLVSLSRIAVSYRCLVSLSHSRVQHKLVSFCLHRLDESQSQNALTNMPFLLNPCILSLIRLKLHGLVYFLGKSIVLHLFEGPELRTHY